jgi:AbrB family looped-hinge helix DNA binding protein
MEIVTVSPEYEVVIPRAIRKSLHIKPGQRFQVLAYGDRMECIPVRPMRKMRGFLKGVDTKVERDRDRV